MCAIHSLMFQEYACLRWTLGIRSTFREMMQYLGIRVQPQLAERPHYCLARDRLSVKARKRVTAGLKTDITLLYPLSIEIPP